jgi:RNA polymerase sigma-70 factor (ECF subfamily)
LEYRTLLFSIAYKMLGSVDAAEDIVQNAFLKWMEMPVQDVKHRKAYLIKMVTNHDARHAYRNIEMYHGLSIGMYEN